jgi:glycosyltransferase involved in cell wall biosynthesis
MFAILNIGSAPASELGRLTAGRAGSEILPREDLHPRRLPASLRRLRRSRPEVLCVYSKDLDHQHNMFSLKLVTVLSGAREIRFEDSLGHTRRLTRAGFLFRDIPLFFLACAYAVSAGLAFAVIAGILRLARRPRQPLVRNSRSFFYLKTDFWFGLQAGGSVTHTREFIHAAAQSGCHVGVLAPDPLEAYRLPVPVKVVPPSRILFYLPQAASQVEYNLRFVFAALRRAREAKPAFLYQRSSQNNLSGTLLARLLRIPFVLEYNSSARWAGLVGESDGGSRLEVLCDKINLGGADLVAVVSEELARRLQNAGVERRRIVVNPNGVNPDVFSDLVPPVSLKAALPADAVIVGFIGIFGQWHGVLTLAAAVKAVVEREPRAHFLVIGDGELKRDMVEILRRDGVEHAVTFTGVVPHEMAPGFLNACDILVSPHEDMADGSPFFGSPTKIFEYMAMAKGIVASRVGQLAEILQDGQNALLVPQRNPQALAQAIAELVADPALRERLGREARRTAIASYTWRDNIERVIGRLSPRTSA